MARATYSCTSTRCRPPGFRRSILGPHCEFGLARDRRAAKSTKWSRSMRARRPQRPQRSFDGPPRRQVDLSTAVETMGTVKWYNPDKGFGFITPQSGGKDVFIHATVLERAGLGPLQEGQTVRMGVVQGQKGPEAGTISLE